MAEQTPPLPFLEAIKARGAAPPSANRPATAAKKAPTSAAPKAAPQPKLPVKQAAKAPSPNKKTSGVFKNVPATTSAAAVSPKAPSPSAKALLEGLKAGQGQLKAPVRSKQPPPIKEAAGPVRPQPLVAKRPSAPVVSSPQPLRSKKSSTVPSAPQTPARQISYKSPSSTKIDRTPATAAPTPSSSQQRIGGGNMTLSPPGTDSGLRLHKSGKYQVIVDRERLCTAFKRLSCRYG